MKKLALFAMLAFAACGGKTPQPTTTTTEAAHTDSKAAAVVELAELKFFEGDDLGMKLHPDGHLEVKGMQSGGGKPPTESWQDVGSIGADGTLTHDGKVHGTFKSDGSFVTADGKTLPFKLDGDTLVADNKKITLDDKGVLQGGNPMPKPMRVEGASTPGLRRTALLVLALMLSSGPESESHGGDAPPTH